MIMTSFNFADLIARNIAFLVKEKEAVIRNIIGDVELEEIVKRGHIQKTGTQEIFFWDNIPKIQFVGYEYAVGKAHEDAYTYMCYGTYYKIL
jgi:hypothetical protein